MKYITFELPALNDELCNEVRQAMESDGEEVIDGCGCTTGGCICRLPKGHEDPHICERCGEEWDV